MELVLNLVSVLVAACLAFVWIHVRSKSDSSEKAHWAVQLVALLLLIVIVFPVISMTDDLYAAQNPAETDSVQRRAHEVSLAHVAAIWAQLPTCGLLDPLNPEIEWRPRARTESASLPQPPVLHSIDSRPPPSA